MGRHLALQVTACVDMTMGGGGALSFAVNGRWLGEAFRLPAPQVRPRPPPCAVALAQQTALGSTPSLLFL